MRKCTVCPVNIHNGATGQHLPRRFFERKSIDFTLTYLTKTRGQPNVGRAKCHSKYRSVVGNSASQVMLMPSLRSTVSSVWGSIADECASQPLSFSS